MATPGVPDALRRIQSTMESCIADGVPGISVAITTPSGEERHLTAGYADLSSRSPINTDSAFGIGSITKVFVAVVILQLIEEEQLSLDASVSSLLPPSKFLDEDQHAATARIGDLLSHTSGIASWEDDPAWIRAGRGEGIDPSKTWGKDETLSYVRPAASDALEMGKFSYANTNYTLLGLIIERITGTTAEAQIRQRILQPLGMRNTYLDTFEDPLDGVDHRPRRYHWATPTFIDSAGLSPHFKRVSGREDLVDVSDTNLSVSWTAGGMMSTPSDLLKFAAALRQPRSAASDKGLLTAASLATLMKWHPVDKKQDMGHGLFRLRQVTAPGNRSWVGHNGGVLGFSAALWWGVDAEGAQEEGEGIDGGCAVAILCNVGSSHAGKMTVTPSAAHDPVRAEILELAGRL